MSRFRKSLPGGAYCFTWEAAALAHRFLYYVEGRAVIPDDHYDFIERMARAEAPPDSPIHGVGSSNPWDYPEEVREIAEYLHDKYEELRLRSISPTHSRKKRKRS